MAIGLTQFPRSDPQADLFVIVLESQAGPAHSVIGAEHLLE